MTSRALWIVLLWIAIIGSKPLSLWFNAGIPVENIGDYLDGSPFDRNVYLALIVVGSWVLLRRKTEWGSVLKSNYWLIAFFIYGGISIIWSDFPFISFKRWLKEDIGTLVMAFIVVTDKNPVGAFQAIFARFTYIVIPLSVVFIKYYPQLGRYYNRWTWEYAYCGIMTSKNELGYIVFICGLLLISDLVRTRIPSDRTIDKLDLLGRMALMLMACWLMHMAHSATSLVSLLLGATIFLSMRLPFVKRQIKYLGIYGLFFCLCFLLLYSVPGILSGLTDVLGRDATLTGRSDIWADLLNEHTNPILGTGSHSFWLGPGAQRMWEKYYFHPTQAHNGYLETYLNGGLIGVGLLIAMIVSTASSIKKVVLLGDGYGNLLFSFFVIIVLYNWSEAMFTGQSVLWIILIIAGLSYPPRSSDIHENMIKSMADR